MAKLRYTDDELFNMYVSLGEDRSLKRLAEVTGYSEVSIYTKSSKYKWTARLAELDESNISLVSAFVADNKNAVAISESIIYRGVSEKLLEIIRDSMPLLAPTSNPRELKTLLDTYRLINGQPTDISRTETAQVNTDALSDAELEGVAEDVLLKLFGAEAPAEA